MAEYTFTHQCGCTKKIEVMTAASAMREQRYIESTPCTDCFFSVANSQAAALQDALGFIRLEGSQSQCEWAAAIRASLYAALTKVKNSFTHSIPGESRIDVTEGAVVSWLFYQQSNARFFIDYRHCGLGAFINLAVLHLSHPGIDIHRVLSAGQGGMQVAPADLQTCVERSQSATDSAWDMIAMVKNYSRCVSDWNELIAKCESELIKLQTESEKPASRTKSNYTRWIRELIETVGRLKDSAARLRDVRTVGGSLVYLHGLAMGQQDKDNKTFL